MRDRFAAFDRPEAGIAGVGGDAAVAVLESQATNDIAHHRGRRRLNISN